MTSLKSIGELEIIHLLQPFLDHMVHLDNNEDAYVINDTPPYILMNVDSMSRASDFLPHQTWKQIGKKLVTSTFSDIAAKGGLPTCFLSSLVLEKDMKKADFIDLIKGIKSALKRYNAKYFGGDLGTAGESTLTGIGVGIVEKGTILARKNARKGDLVCVTGEFGLTSLGFKLLLEGEEKSIYPEFLTKKALQQLYEPEPRIQEGLILSNTHFNHACIDSSDGLAISLHWLTQASNVGILVNQLPLNKDLTEIFTSPQERIELTMYGGEEYELIFTIPEKCVQKVKSSFEEKGCIFTVIGKCIDKPGVYFKEGDKKISIEKRGWDTFRY